VNIVFKSEKKIDKVYLAGFLSPILQYSNTPTLPCSGLYIAEGRV
jgi:hypothetical protein